MQHRRRRPRGSGVPDKKKVPSNEISSATGNCEREKNVEDTLMELLEPFTDGLEEDDADSSNQMAGGNSRRGIEEHLLDEKPPTVVNVAVKGALLEESKGGE